MEWINLPTRATVMERLLSRWKPERTIERIPLDEGLDRVIAETLCAQYSLPVVRASSMDGVAVKSALFADGVPDTSGWATGNQYIRADTGDDFDDAYDAVIPVEDVALSQAGIVIHPEVTVRPGMNIRPAGSFFIAGDRLVEQGRKLTPSLLAALAAGGITELPVYRKPRVAFLPTGSELIPAGSLPVRGKNIDSNSVLVRHTLIQQGALPLCYPIVADDPAALAQALSEALAAADIVILNGGSSKGEEDFNARLLAGRGEILCHGVAAAPGKPLCAAMVDGKPVINLPGPSIAAFYGLDWCVGGLIRAYLGQPVPLRPTVEAVLTEEIRDPRDMEILCKMELRQTAQGYETRQVPFRASTVIDNLTAPGVYITKLGVDRCAPGETLEVELL